jgi:hypothetical protein
LFILVFPCSTNPTVAHPQQQQKSTETYTVSATAIQHYPQRRTIHFLDFFLTVQDYSSYPDIWPLCDFLITFSSPFFPSNTLPESHIQYSVSGSFSVLHFPF